MIAVLDVNKNGIRKIPKEPTRSVSIAQEMRTKRQIRDPDKSF